MLDVDNLGTPGHLESRFACPAGRWIWMRGKQAIPVVTGLRNRTVTLVAYGVAPLISEVLSLQVSMYGCGVS